MITAVVHHPTSLPRSQCPRHTHEETALFYPAGLQTHVLGHGLGDLGYEGLRFLVQILERQHQSLQQLCIIGKTKISDPGITESFSTMALVHSSAVQAAYRSV